MNYYQKKCDGIMHTVKKGDTLYRLSRMYSVSVDDIMDANPDVNVYNLQIGSSVCIPMTMPAIPTPAGRPGETAGGNQQDRNQQGRNQQGRNQQGENTTSGSLPEQPANTGMPEGFIVPGMPFFEQDDMQDSNSENTQPDFTSFDMSDYLRNMNKPVMEDIASDGESMSWNTSDNESMGWNTSDNESMGWNMSDDDSMGWNMSDDDSMDWNMNETTYPYRVIRGDTINSVLEDFNMDFDTFARLNPQIMPIPLKPGDTIFVTQPEPQTRR